MKKPEFIDVPIDPDFICWPVGNDLVSLRTIAVIKLREKTDEENAIEKAKYEECRRIYEKHINVGATFNPGNGKGKFSSTVAKITAINPKTMMVSWISNIPEEYKITSQNVKPAKGKWSICGTIRASQLGYIKFIDNANTN